MSSLSILTVVSTVLTCTQGVEWRSGRHFFVSSLSIFTVVSTVLAGTQGMDSVGFLHSGTVRVKWR